MLSSLSSLFFLFQSNLQDILRLIFQKTVSQKPMVQFQSPQQFSTIYRIKFRNKVKIQLALLDLFPVFHFTPAFFCIHIYACTYLPAPRMPTQTAPNLSPIFILFSVKMLSAPLHIYTKLIFSCRCNSPPTACLTISDATQTLPALYLNTGLPQC